ncbi:MAG: cation:proton antiporter, partial [Pseudomonadales bacterium]|nr:cation:proton antiporter [Pseudomonadales bacterium]
MLTDQIIIYFVICALIALSLGFLMSLIRLPVFTGYILAGALLGPHGTGFVSDTDLMNQLGSVGVVLLLFFIGVEISPRQIIEKWRIAVLGTLLQVLFSVAAVGLLGLLFDWPVARIVLLGFVISLSCTAVVVDFLKGRGEMGTAIGQNLLAILVMQDLFVVPMLITLGLLGGEGVEVFTLWRQLAGCVLIVSVLLWVVRRDQLSFPVMDRLSAQPDLQVFSALLFCFAMAFITGMLQLSTALGSFFAGMLVGRTKELHWIDNKLEAIKIIFVALFFASVGALIDTRFLLDYWVEVVFLVVLVLLVNTLINAGLLKLLGVDAWDSVYGGALLAHVGEFSFVLAAIGLNVMIVTEVSYQLTVATIALTLFLGPVWVGLVRRMLGRRPAGSSVMS